jgi:hypothetical protein
MSAHLSRSFHYGLTDDELQELWNLSLIHTPDSEMAHKFNFNSREWITYKDKFPAIQDFIDKARAEGAYGLRRAQWDAALHGNTTMQIWLGRHYLGQNEERMEVQMSQAQLSDISPETRQHLIKLRNAIYKPESEPEPEPKPENVIEVELTRVNGDET